MYASYPVVDDNVDDVAQMELPDVLAEMDALNHADVSDSEKRGVIRRYEALIATFENFFGRVTDIQADHKDRLLLQLGDAYDGQKGVLDRKTLGTVCFQALGGAAGLASGSLPAGAFKDAFEMGSKILPKAGEFVGATSDASSVTHQKKQQLTNAAMTSQDTRLSSLQRIRDTYNAARQRLDELKSRAHGG